MMSEVIQKETLVFFLSVAHGIGLTVLYDLLRALRRVFRHGIAAVSAEDFLFWIMASFLTFCLVFSETDGVVRGYVAAGIAIGAVLYHQTFSNLVVCGCVRLLSVIKGIFGLLYHIVGVIRTKIWRISGKVGRIVSIPVRKIWIKRKKRIEIRRKKGYNMTKAIRRESERKDQRGKRHGKKEKKKAQPQ